MVGSIGKDFEHVVRLEAEYLQGLVQAQRAGAFEAMLVGPYHPTPLQLPWEPFRRKDVPWCTQDDQLLRLRVGRHRGLVDMAGHGQVAASGRRWKTR